MDHIGGLQARNNVRVDALDRTNQLELFFGGRELVEFAAAESRRLVQRPVEATKIVQQKGGLGPGSGQPIAFAFVARFGRFANLAGPLGQILDPVWRTRHQPHGGGVDAGVVAADSLAGLLVAAGRFCRPSSPFARSGAQGPILLQARLEGGDVLAQ